MSNTAASLAPPKIRWDLSALFNGPADPRIEASWISANSRADAFSANYRGKIEAPNLDAKTLSGALFELESLLVEASKPVVFANLLFSCDAASPEIGSFMQKQMERSTELSVKLLFFELELQKTPDDAIEKIINDPQLENYTHYIRAARVYKPHRLSEPEEIILEETSNTGARAFQRLFDEVTANYVYKLDGKDVTEQEVLNQLRNPNRSKRQAAADALTAGLQDLQRVLAFTYNTLIQDKRVEDRLRSYPYPEYSRHLSNELDKETVDLVVSLCRQNYPMVARYYETKRQILGFSELTHIDRYAPLFEAEAEIGFEEAKELVLRSFGEFSAEVKNRAEEFFTKNWIDAEPRPGKTGGAFCSYNTPDTHPVIFLSYLNKMDNVGTLAHELGHGVHASLSRSQTYFNFHGTLPLAELASTFGEMLVFEKLVATATTKDKLALYADKIEQAFATIFRQAAMFRFEQRCHEFRRENGELSPENFGDIWQEEIQAMFGDSVKLGEQHRCWWSYVSHFIAAPFYVYAYSFGELLSMSLFQMAKEEGAAFEPKYLELLSLGGSRTPFELMETVGVNLRSNAFWQGGFDALEKLIVEFERLYSESKDSL